MKEFFKSLKKSKCNLLFNLGIILSLLFLFLFLLITQNILAEGLLVKADVQILNLITSSRDINVVKIMLFFTYLSNWQIIVSLGIILVVILWLTQKKQLISFFLSGLVSGGIIYTIFKLIVHRLRPEVGFALIRANGYSFPSGHTMMSVIFYGMIGYYLFQLTKKGGRKLLVFILSLLLIFLIGFSRIYLGVHWLSDVLGGWAFGLFLLFLLITIFKQREKMSQK